MSGLERHFIKHMVGVVRRTPNQNAKTKHNTIRVGFESHLHDLHPFQPEQVGKQNANRSN